MALKCGSLNSFLMAAFFTPGSTSRARKRAKSESRVRRATSSSVGGGAVCAAGVASAAGGVGCPAAEDRSAAGSTGDGGGCTAGTVGAAGCGSPRWTSALRRAQRDRKPGSGGELIATRVWMIRAARYLSRKASARHTARVQACWGAWTRWPWRSRQRRILGAASAVGATAARSRSRRWGCSPAPTPGLG